MMKAVAKLTISLLLLQAGVHAASRPHSVVLGKWRTVMWTRGDEGSTKPSDLKVRPLIVDGRNKEWTIGSTHDVTDQTFVVQQVRHMNDSLPSESGAVRWRWEPSAWLLVDRTTGKSRPVVLPAFDPETSVVTWFRDYAAYCGTTSDGKKQLAVVVQVGQRKPILKKELTGAPAQEPVCPSPAWERNPVRVTFAPKNESPFTLEIRSRMVDALARDKNDQ